MVNNILKKLGQNFKNEGYEVREQGNNEIISLNGEDLAYTRQYQLGKEDLVLMYPSEIGFDCDENRSKFLMKYGLCKSLEELAKRKNISVTDSIVFQVDKSIEFHTKELAYNEMLNILSSENSSELEKDLVARLIFPI